MENADFDTFEEVWVVIEDLDACWSEECADTEVPDWMNKLSDQFGWKIIADYEHPAVEKAGLAGGILNELYLVEAFSKNINMRIDTWLS